APADSFRPSRGVADAAVSQGRRVLLTAASQQRGPGVGSGVQNQVQRGQIRREPKSGVLLLIMRGAVLLVSELDAGRLEFPGVLICPGPGSGEVDIGAERVADADDQIILRSG